MRPTFSRIALLLAVCLFIAAVASLPGMPSLAQLYASESADSGSYLPAIFNNAGQAPQPSPTVTPSPTLPPGTTATATATQAATRPPKATETPSPTVVGTPTTTPTVTPTPEATNTPVVIATSTPGIGPGTVTPTATATPQTSQAVVLPNTSSYVDQGQQLHLVGEVQNNGPTSIQYVSIKAKFYSLGGLELEDATTYGKLSILPPGEKTCFQFVLPLPPGYGSYKFTDVDHLPDPPSPLPLSFSNVLAKFSPSNGFYDLAGKLTNNGATELLDVTAIGTLYDAAGIVRGCQEVPLGINDPIPSLAPGANAAFQMTFTGRYNADVTTYRLQADGKYPEEE